MRLEDDAVTLRRKLDPPGPGGGTAGGDDGSACALATASRLTLEERQDEGLHDDLPAL
jgi:hypothetical protein